MRKVYLIHFLPVLMLMFACTHAGSDRMKEEAGLSVSSDGHYILRNGKPFFWMGDTGWFLFTLSPDDVDLYFQNRVDNQFNTIQMMVLNRQFNNPDFRPNYRGDMPFESLDPVKLNESYFTHIDAIIEKAEKHNLVLAMFPIWGTILDQVFSVNDPGKAYDYGFLLGKRYRNHKNIIWSVCGEYHKIAWDTEPKKPDSKPDEQEISLIENLALGLEAGHQGKQLMTIHPDGWLSSSDDFHHAEWLDFNMVQSWSIGRGTEFDIINDYRRIPYKPTILAEPGYEFGGAGHKAFEVRYEGYHSLLNGAFGYTYGCEGVWNALENWKNLLNSEGAMQMKYIRKLFESRPALQRIPASEMIVGGQGEWTKLTKISAARADDGAYAFIYFPADAISAEIRVSEISGKSAAAWWYNPRDGETYDAQGMKTNRPFAEFPCHLHQVNVFDPPGEEGAGKDWVLILDDMDRGFEKP